MTIERIEELQKEYGYSNMQNLINSGECWKMEGSMGRAAMGCLETGACMLPDEEYQDFYGNTVPARSQLKEGTKGTFQNSVNFWSGVEEGSIFLECEY